MLARDIRNGWISDIERVGASAALLGLSYVVAGVVCIGTIVGAVVMFLRRS